MVWRKRASKVASDHRDQHMSQHLATARGLSGRWPTPRFSFSGLRCDPGLALLARSALLIALAGLTILSIQAQAQAVSESRTDAQTDTEAEARMGADLVRLSVDIGPSS